LQLVDYEKLQLRIPELEQQLLLEKEKKYESPPVQQPLETHNKTETAPSEEIEEEAPKALPEGELVRQWASSVIDFSSQAAEDGPDGSWGVHGVLGDPSDRITGYGDTELSWAPAETNGGHEWVIVKFDRKVRASKVAVVENWNPGAVVSIEIQKEDESYFTIW